MNPLIPDIPRLDPDSQYPEFLELYHEPRDQSDPRDPSVSRGDPLTVICDDTRVCSLS